MECGSRRLQLSCKIFGNSETRKWELCLGKQGCGGSPSLKGIEADLRFWEFLNLELLIWDRFRY